MRYDRTLAVPAAGRHNSEYQGEYVMLRARHDDGAGGG